MVQTWGRMKWRDRVRMELRELPLHQTSLGNAVTGQYVSNVRGTGPWPTSLRISRYCLRLVIFFLGNHDHAISDQSLFVNCISFTHIKLSLILGDCKHECPCFVLT